VTLATVMAAGCGGPTGQPSGRHSAAPPAPSSAPLSAWQKLGATEVPPASLKQVALGRVQVVNQTGGAASDDQARTWARAYLREYGYLSWAVSHGQDAFLLHAGLSSAPLAIFQPNLTEIVQARQAGNRVEWQSATVRRLVVRAVPQTLQALFQSYRFAWKPYAIFVDQVGPSADTWVDAQGHRTVRFQSPAGAAAYELVGGELKRDPLMGDVWAPASDWSCDDVHNRQNLGSLCSAS
jgi:hypothetical protein